MANIINGLCGDFQLGDCLSMPSIEYLATSDRSH